jgi:hypothetical protein
VAAVEQATGSSRISGSSKLGINTDEPGQRSCRSRARSGVRESVEWCGNSCIVDGRIDTDGGGEATIPAALVDE